MEGEMEMRNLPPSSLPAKDKMGVWSGGTILKKSKFYW
jgi:hypothetical protein